MKTTLKTCRNAAEVEAEVRRISETCVTHPPACKLRCVPLRPPTVRMPKVFHPWDGKRDWQLSYQPAPKPRVRRTFI